MIQIWDNHNKQWLEPMVIFFARDNSISRIDACKPGDVPLDNGWYKLEGKDLEKIAITGQINYNSNLLPKDLTTDEYMEDKAKNNNLFVKSFHHHFRGIVYYFFTFDPDTDNSVHLTKRAIGEIHDIDNFRFHVSIGEDIYKIFPDKESAFKFLIEEINKIKKDE
jgi:hypothetical protein